MFLLPVGLPLWRSTTLTLPLTLPLPISLPLKDVVVQSNGAVWFTDPIYGLLEKDRFCDEVTTAGASPPPPSHTPLFKASMRAIKQPLGRVRSLTIAL
jgi:hypothetical protein